MSEERKTKRIGVRLLWFALGFICCGVCMVAGYVGAIYIDIKTEGSLWLPDDDFMRSSSLEEIVDRYGLPRVVYYREYGETPSYDSPMYVYDYDKIDWQEWQEKYCTSEQQVYAVGYYLYPDDGERHKVLVVVLDEKLQAVTTKTGYVGRKDEM